jgi:hypothetical protein
MAESISAYRQETLMNITSNLVIELWEYMEEAYGSRRVNKSNAPEMEMVANFLDGLNILDKNAFLEDFTTTIARTIYIPFEVGVAEPGRSLLSQIGTCIHEHQHVVQFIRDGVTFMADYVTYTAKRAAYEVDAYRCNLEMYYLLTKTIPDTDAVAEQLHHYGCTELDIQVSAKALGMIARTIKMGGLTSEAGITAARWLTAK